MAEIVNVCFKVDTSEYRSLLGKLQEALENVDDIVEQISAVEIKYTVQDDRKSDADSRAKERKTLLDEVVRKYPDSWYIEEGNPNVIGE